MLHPPLSVSVAVKMVVSRLCEPHRGPSIRSASGEVVRGLLGQAGVGRQPNAPLKIGFGMLRTSTRPNCTAGGCGCALPPTRPRLWSGLSSALNRLVLEGFVADLGRLHGPLAKEAARMRADGSCL
jgi:hypothetical protein